MDRGLGSSCVFTRLRHQSHWEYGGNWMQECQDAKRTMENRGTGKEIPRYLKQKDQPATALEQTLRRVLLGPQVVLGAGDPSLLQT